MKNESACLFALAAGLFAMTASAVASPVGVVDFSGGRTPEGWTLQGGAYRSPEYSGAVDRIELRYPGSAADGSATIYASSNNVETQVAILSAASSAATFDFPDTTDFRSFRIATVNGFSLSSFTAYVSASVMEAPAAVAVSNNVTGTSFDAYWNPVADATGYRVYVWTNAVVGASAGTEVWQETFANSPAKSSSTVFNVSYTDSGESAWTFDKVYAHSEVGMVRVGNTSAKGVLVSPALGDAVAVSDSLVLRIHVCKQESKDGDFMPVGIVSGDATNILEVLEITTTPTEYNIALPTLSATDRLAFLSPTNKSSARAIIDDVAIVSGYSEGHEAPAYIIDGQDVGEATYCSFAGLPSVPVCFAVEAYGRRGVSSAKTETIEVDLSNPDKTAALNACPISSLADKTYTQNFDSLAALTTATGDKEWLNGTTLQYWQAYRNGDAETSFNYNGGAGTVGGLYVISANRGDAIRALGAYSTKDNEFSFGIAFTNDTENTLVLSSVVYSAQQWGFKNDTNQTISVSVMVTNRLDWIVDFADGWTELASTQSYVYGEGVAHDTPVSTPVTVEQEAGASVAPGQVLMLKWTIHSLKSGKPGMMAIDDLEVRFAPAARAFVISIVKH